MNPDSPSSDPLDLADDSAQDEEFALGKATRGLRAALEAEEEIEAVLVIERPEDDAATGVADAVGEVSSCLKEAGLTVESRPYSRAVKVKGSSRAMKKGLAIKRVRSAMLQGKRVRVRAEGAASKKTG